MASQVSTYQCPRCTGPLEFSSETGKLECKFCRSSFTVEEYDAAIAKQTTRAAEAFEQKDAAQAATKGTTKASNEDWAPDMREYSCPDCGAVLAADANTAVICCPYCGNRAMVPGVFSGMRRPDYVISFKKTKADAEEALWMEDELMDSILPYRYKEKKPFSMAYFAGYCAEKFDVTVDECAERAKEQCINTAVDTLNKW